MSIAADSSLESARCAVFLLGWFAPGEVGGVDLSLIAWALSPQVAADMVNVFSLMVRMQQSCLPLDSLGINAKFRPLLKKWFPEVLGQEPAVPDGEELIAFRFRHDLTIPATAAMVRVSVATYTTWEKDEFPIPLPLWIELRALMGERRSVLTVPGISAEIVK
jgi:hypothetical protein